MLVSIVIPCFNEEQNLPLYYQQTTKVVENLPATVEFIFVNDGSTDQTGEILKTLAQKDQRVKYLTLSKNFGKESAMYAGLSNAQGDYVAVMDADLQDPPELLTKMYEILSQNDAYDIVCARRVNRTGEPRLRSFLAGKFYQLMSRNADVQIPAGARDYRLMSRRVIDAVLALDEYNRFSKGIFAWVGFQTYWLPYENVTRAKGQSKWSVGKLFRYASSGVINFSHLPLHVISLLGLGFTAAALISLIILAICYALNRGSALGLVLTVILLLGGIQIFSIGLIGQYLARTYMEVKKRPHYIVAETNLLEAERVK